MILRPHFSIVLRLSFVVLLTFKNSSENIFEGPCLERFWTSSDANVSMKMKFCKKRKKKVLFKVYTKTRSSKLSVVKENLATLRVLAMFITNCVLNNVEHLENGKCLAYDGSNERTMMMMRTNS